MLFGIFCSRVIGPKRLFYNFTNKGFTFYEESSNRNEALGNQWKIRQLYSSEVTIFPARTPFIMM